MLRFIDDKTKNVIMDDGDLLLSDFKDSGLIIFYDEKKFFLNQDVVAPCWSDDLFYRLYVSR